jgi:hypothetical protein
MSDYFAQLPVWKALAWLVVLGVIGGVLLWHICTGEKNPKPRDPWDWKE